jgi:YHS domain-containing protein
MSKWILISLSSVAAIAVGLAVVGCSRESSEPVEGPKLTPPSESTSAVEDASPSDVPEELADLSEADRAAVLAQKVCPVSGQELGAMGTPIKVTVEGRDVFLCCEGCKDDLLADPGKYLAKLDANKLDANK